MEPVAYPESSWTDQYIHRTHEGTTMVGAAQVNFQNLSPDALHHLVLSVLKFLCEIFSKLLNFTSQNTLLSG